MRAVTNAGRMTASGMAKLANTSRQLRPLNSGKTTSVLSRRRTSRHALAAVQPVERRSKNENIRATPKVRFLRVYLTAGSASKHALTPLFAGHGRGLTVTPAQSVAGPCRREVRRLAPESP